MNHNSSYSVGWHCLFMPLFFFVVILPISKVWSATITVNSAEDDPIQLPIGACTLRDAIIAANTDSANGNCNAGSGFDTINFDPNVSNLGITITLQSELPIIERDVEIIGPGRDRLIIDGSGTYRIFTITTLGTQQSKIEGMTLRFGGGRGIDPSKDGQGGAMMVTSGDVLLKRVEFMGNVATTVGGAIYAGVGNNISLTVVRCEFIGNLVLSTRMDHGGGAIGFVSNGSELKIKKSTFSANSVRRPSEPQDPEGPMGGALFIRSLGNIPQTVSIVDSTFSGNRAAAHGGAIYITRTGALTPSPVVSITDSTFINNIADEDVNDLGDGGAIYVVGATPTIMNTIIAMNRDLSPSSTIVNDLNGTFTSGGYNLLGTIDGSTGINSPSDNAGSIVNPITPLIGVLADNGGFGKTHMPDPQGQWIIDRGRCDPGTLDQRMRRRPYNSPTHSRAPGGNNCDIGAVEYRP